MSKNEVSPTTPPEGRRSIVVESGVLPRRFPEFALLDTQPFPDPLNTRQKIYNEIYRTLQDHPFRWINTTTLAENTGSTHQRAAQILGKIPNINLLKITPTQIDQQHLTEHVAQLEKIGLTREQVIFETGAPARRITPVHIELNKIDTSSKVFLKNFISALRLGSQRYGDHDIHKILDALYPGQISLAKVMDTIERLIEEDPNHRLRRKRGSLIGDKILIDQISRMYTQGYLPGDIARVIGRENINRIDISNILNTIATRDPFVKLVGQSNRQQVYPKIT